MKLSANTNYIAKQFGFTKSISMMADAGFDALDFSAFDEEYFTDAHDKAFYTDARKLAEDRGLFFNQAHAPFPSSYGDKIKDEERFNHIVASMKHASWLGVKNIVVHPCQHLEYVRPGVPEKLFELNMDFYSRLLPYCEEYNIRVAVENMWQYPQTVSHSTCSRPAEFLRYLNELNNDHFVACLDTGHALLVKEKPDDMVRILGSRHLQCLHVHDIDGIHDSHTLPYYGITDWQSFMEALADIDYQGELTFEASNFFKNVPAPLLSESLRYMVAVGRHMIGIYDACKNK